MAKTRIRWFKAALAGGLLLSFVLLAGSVTTYRYVSTQMVRDHLDSMARDYAAIVESRVRGLDPENMDRVGYLLEAMREEHSQQIAWISILGDKGEVLADSVSGKRALPPAQRPTVQQKREAGVHVAAFPVHFTGAAKAKAVQIALFLPDPGSPISRLRRGLILTSAASLALLASMVVFVLRLNSYIRSKEWEQHLALARRVQRELLPASGIVTAGLSFAADVLPAEQVGGDFYDLFPLSNGRTAIALGDVSGKGLPAALLAGLLHGSIRTAAGIWDGSRGAELAHQLNQLLLNSTSAEKFVTLFWACYDPRSGYLRYVNAGHLPPLLVRANGDGISGYRLESGGPVLGLLPQAVYEEGSVRVSPGDLLVVYSDGLTEATDASGSEFGEKRLEELILASQNKQPREIWNEVVKTVTRFSSGRGGNIHDDLTLLVARLEASQPVEELGGRETASGA